MANKNFFVDGGNVQAQEGAIYLRRAADDQLLALCRAETFAYVLTARQMGKSSLMVNTAEQLAAEGIRTVEIDLTRIGVKVTKEEWYLGILFEVQSQLRLKQDVIEWWREPQRRELSAAQRLLLFFEHVVLAEVSQPVIIFVDEIETTLRLDFTDDFFAAVRSVHNARSGRRFQRLAFVLIGAATPDSLIRDQQLTPFNIGQSVVLSDFTFDEALPLADGFGLGREEARSVLRRVLHWSGGHPYLTQRLCRAIAEEKRAGWTEGAVDEVVAKVFFDDQSDVEKNLRFVREMLLTSELDRGDVLKTYREILREGSPVLDEDQALIKSHLKLSGVVKRQGTALHVRNPIYREVFSESWVKSNTPINWTRRLQRAASVAVALFFIALLPLALYAWAKKAQAEEAKVAAERALHNETSLRQELEQALGKEKILSQQLQQANRQLRAANDEAEEQREKAQVAARQEKAAKEKAEVQGAKAREAQRESFIKGLILNAQALETKKPELLPDRVRLARDAFLQAKQAESQGAGAPTDDPLSSLAYQGLMESAMLLPRSVTIPFTGGKVNDAMIMKDGQTLVGLSKDSPVLQTWDLKNHKTSVLKVADSGQLLNYSPGGKYVAVKGQDPKVMIRELESGQGFDISIKAAQDSELPWVMFSPDENYVFLCPCDGESTAIGLWRTADGRKVADISSKELLRIRFSPDGEFVYTVYVSGTIQAVETRTGRTFSNEKKIAAPGSAERQDETPLTHNLEEDAAKDGGKSVAFSENGKFLAISTLKVVEVWDLSDARSITRVASITFGTGRQQSVRGGLAISNDGRLLTVKGESGATIDLWDVTNNRFIHTINTASTNCTSFNPNGRNFSTCSGSVIRLWDAETGLEIHRIVGEKDFDTSFFAPDGNSLITINEDGLTQLWELSNDEQSLRALFDFTQNGADLTLERRYFVNVDQGGRTALVWDLRSGGVVASRKFDHKINHVGFSPDGDEIVVVTSGEDTYTARLWSWRSGDAGALWQTELGPVELSYIGSDHGGKYLAALLTKDNVPVVRIWDARPPDGAAKPSWDLSVRGASSIGFIPNTDYLVVVNGTGTQLWDILNDRPVGAMIGRGSKEEKPKPTFYFSEDGAYIAAYSAGTKSVEIAETATGAIVASLPHSKGVKSLDINFDGSVVVTAGAEDDTMRVWLRDKPQRPISQVRYAAEVVSINREGTYVTSTAGVDSIRVWDISRPGTISEAARIQPGQGASGAVFSYDTRYLYTFTGSQLQAWQWHPSQLVCEATNRLVQKNLSLEEWLGKGYVLRGEKDFLKDEYKLNISCGAAPSMAQK